MKRKDARVQGGCDMRRMLRMLVMKMWKVRLRMAGWTYTGCKWKSPDGKCWTSTEKAIEVVRGRKNRIDGNGSSLDV